MRFCPASELILLLDVVLWAGKTDRLPDPERGDPLLAGLDLGARVQRQLVRVPVLEPDGAGGKEGGKV